MYTTQTGASSGRLMTAQRDSVMFSYIWFMKSKKTFWDVV